ncbi:tRNA synthetases class I, catalytic domain-containing protein [Kalaharituber pfeilii]|nr:tRNA synthetases class I, catalytic domain-containing protein [Kalaharituber pfeilii]
MAEEDRLTLRFRALGLTDKSIKETFKNKKLTAAFSSILDEADIKADHEQTTPVVDAKVVAGLTYLATQTKESQCPKREVVTKAIVDGRLKTNVQIQAALEYLRGLEAEGKLTDYSEEVLERECGVGIELTKEEIAAIVNQYIEANKERIIEERYKLAQETLSVLKNTTALKWAPPLDVKKEVDAQFEALIGPKDERDNEKKKSKAKPAATASAKVNTEEPKKPSDPLNTTSMFEEGFLANLHKPGGNYQIIPENREKHLRETGGKVFTRFPPEPNGYLHIGHSKAIAINFGFARYHGGECYLRYDDTNPEAEEERYFVAIREIVEWLGFKPYQITYSSDHFQRLYELAEDLVKRGFAYICHCTAEEVHEQRGGDHRGPRYACKHRDRPNEESLTEFRAMRDGKYKPKEAMLRMKQDLEDGNPQMWDLTAYRILETPHHRTGNQWRIYPTYDFTHCLCDSFENITHSLCTTEFINSRQSYDWLCNALEIYRPQQSEYGRLNLTGTIMSKRKIAKLVNQGYVRGWDDPRLYTLVAIRRRGVPPGAILAFVNELGVTTATTNIQIKRFENSIRKYLEETVPRLMMVLDPVLVVIENLPEDYYEALSVPFKPGAPKMGEHEVPFTRKVYIDRSDFRETDSKDYFRLAPGKSVGLFKVPFPIKCTSFTKDPETGLVTEIFARYENDVEFVKPKTYIQWVADSPPHRSPIVVEVRLFNQLFKSDDPESNPDGFLADINPNSEEVFKGAMIEVGFEEVRRRAPWPEREGEKNAKNVGKESTRFQALRVGYFAMDGDSDDSPGGTVVLNRIVTLKEDAGKNA